MSLDLQAAVQVFFAECDELLTRMEEALLELEGSSDAASTIDEIFRAAHTIKGSAGLFGFDQVVAFTHNVESLLDGMRANTVPVTSSGVELLLQARDHILALLRHAGDEAPLPDDVAASGASLTQKLLLALQSDPSAVSSAPSDSTDSEADSNAKPRGSSTSTSGVVLATPKASGAQAAAESSIANTARVSDCWHLSLRFGPDVLRNGMDPLSFLLYLQTLGQIESLELLYGNLPDLDDLDPEACYLGFEIAFASAADRQTIESVFEFVREDCLIHIVPPHSQVQTYLDLIEALPEEPLKLGEILVRVGALTPSELQLVLDHQARLQAEAAGRPQSNAAQEAAQPLGEILIDSGVIPGSVVHEALGKQQKAREAKPAEAQFLRVDSEKLDHLIELVGELVVANASVQMLGQAQGPGPLSEAAEVLARLVEEVRDTTLSLRMVQIGPTFQRFQRVVRDVSKDLQKDIELVIEGAETELDKTVVERIGDPLMHLVRNSMDHGIELPAVRLAAGKPSKAALTLAARHDAGNIVIEVRDDGAGLNRPKIRAKAIERGIIAPDATLSDREIDQLIFAAGFSTADAVSNLSGRGVGMDVVRRDIEALRGSVEIESTPGAGTVIRIRLPLTLAIIDGFLVGIGSARFVLPVDLIAECVELPSQDKALLQQRGYMDLRGEVLPLLWLRKVLDLQHLPTVRRENILVLQAGRARVGLVVDVLLGEHQTVIRPLGKLFSSLRGVSGSTILGGGEVALILDVAGLLQLGRARSAQIQNQGASPSLISGSPSRATSENGGQVGSIKVLPAPGVPT